MNNHVRNSLLAIVVCLLVIDVGKSFLGPSGPVPGPGPSPIPSGPDLYQVFNQTENHTQGRTDALRFSMLCSSLASRIDYDGKSPTPRITTGVQVDDLRRWARAYQLHGQSYGTRYPSLGPVVGQYLLSRLGDSGGSIDIVPEGSSISRRAIWVECYNSLADSAVLASKRI